MKKSILVRRGTTALEAIVAFTLLSTVLSVSLPLVVKHNRLLIDQRGYRIALDELSNQLERLTALPVAEIPAALAQISPSEFAAERLSGLELTGKLEPVDVGRRATLQLAWSGPLRRTISLAAWIVPRPQAPDEQETDEEIR